MPDDWSTTPGIYDGIPNHVYHADREAVSRSWLKEIGRSPAHLQHYLAQPVEAAPMSALALGSALHCGVFTPDLWADEVAVMPKLNLRTNDGKAARDEFYAEHAGKSILRDTQLEICEEMVASVRNHSKASKLIKGCELEQTIVWRDDEETREKIQKYARGPILGNPSDLYCKARSDARKGNLWIDLKSSKDASYDKFRRDCVNFSYNLQPPFYMDGGIAHGIKPDHFIFIVVENVPPYACAVYRIDENDIEKSRDIYMHRLTRVARCKAEEHWPGYPEQVIDLDLPPWAYNEAA